VHPVTGRFYKYRPIGPDGGINRERLRQIIVENQIYFAKPSTLNDPHDCRPATIAPSGKELRKLAKAMGRRVRERNQIKVSRRAAHTLDTQTVLRLSDPVQRNKALFDSLDKNTGIFCTSETPVSSTQWAYYADSHKGVCLEFSVGYSTSFVAIRINYTNQRPLIDLVKFLEDEDYRTEQTGIAITTKSDDWLMEKEVRLITGKPRLYRYDPTTLTKVIFGVDTPECYIDFILELVKEAKIKPEISKCRPDESNYNLHIN